MPAGEPESGEGVPPGLPLPIPGGPPRPRPRPRPATQHRKSKAIKNHANYYIKSHLFLYLHLCRGCQAKVLLQVKARVQMESWPLQPRWPFVSYGKKREKRIENKLYLS